MATIIRLLLIYNQYLQKQIFDLLQFISTHIPLKQWTFDDSNSPKYQKFKIDILPTIIKFEKQDYRFLIRYYYYRYNYTLRPIRRRKKSNVSKSLECPKCGAPHEYLYDNNGGLGQYLCSVCNFKFSEHIHEYKPLKLKCPYCNKALEHKKSHKFFRVHKCVNMKCSYYLTNLKKIPSGLSHGEKSKYKLHFIYREFTVDFFKMNLTELPNWVTSLSFKKHTAHIMGLCLTYNVNLNLSLRQTSQALKDVHGINISHTMVANYLKTASIIIKPFVDSFDYNPSNSVAADETYIKVRGATRYVWFAIDVISRSILGYQVSENRSVGPCILMMRMTFDKYKVFPGKALRFVADGYSAYLLAAQQFAIKENKIFDVTQVIGLSNDDAVSEKYRYFKQIVERVNRTFKRSYRSTNGYDKDSGAVYGVNLWVAYYNFLRPHMAKGYKPLNYVETLQNADNMPAKWQLLIFLGQQTILEMQSHNTS